MNYGNILQKHSTLLCMCVRNALACNSYTKYTLSSLHYFLQIPSTI